MMEVAISNGFSIKHLNTSKACRKKSTVHNHMKFNPVK